MRGSESRGWDWIRRSTFRTKGNRVIALRARRTRSSHQPRSSVSIPRASVLPVPRRPRGGASCGSQQGQLSQPLLPAVRRVEDDALGFDEVGEEARRLGAELVRVGLASPDCDQVHVVVAVAAPGDDA